MSAFCDFYGCVLKRILNNEIGSFVYFLPISSNKMCGSFSESIFVQDYKDTLKGRRVFVQLVIILILKSLLTFPKLGDHIPTRSRR